METLVHLKDGIDLEATLKPLRELGKIRARSSKMVLMVLPPEKYDDVRLMPGVKSIEPNVFLHNSPGSTSSVVVE